MVRSYDSSTSGPMSSRRAAVLPGALAALCGALVLFCHPERSDTGIAGAAELRDEVPASEAHAMVVTEQHEATRTGLQILLAGGNAVDAAVAVAYALAVVDPCCGNIGGGGFM